MMTQRRLRGSLTAACRPVKKWTRVGSSATSVKTSSKWSMISTNAVVWSGGSTRFAARTSPRLIRTELLDQTGGRVGGDVQQHRLQLFEGMGPRQKLRDQPA